MGETARIYCTFCRALAKMFSDFRQEIFGTRLLYQMQSPSEKVSILKERIYSPFAPKFYPFREDPFSEGK